MLISIAIDHLNVDLATRERFYRTSHHIEQLYVTDCDDGVTEMTFLATCNRNELYAWCPMATTNTVADFAARLAVRWMGNSHLATELLRAAVVRSGDSIVRHAARVAAGLESQALADGQILGQLREAHRVASELGASGVVLHRLMQTALRAGKRVHANTTFHSGTNSVGAQAVSEAARRLGSLSDARVAVVGCGKTNERAARQLVRMGVRDLVLLNRSEHRAYDLAQELETARAPMESLHEIAATADVMIVATGSVEPILMCDALSVARERHGTTMRPLLIMDLAMPRNVQPTVADIDNVTLLNLDSLQPVLTATERARRAAIPAAEQIVEAEVAEFASWLAASGAREAMRPLHDTLVEVCRREIAYATDEASAERISRRITAKVLARPMLAMRAAISRGEPLSELSRNMRQLFAPTPSDQPR